MEKPTESKFKEDFFENLTVGIKTLEIWKDASQFFILGKKLLEKGPIYDFIISDETSARLLSLFCKKYLMHKGKKLVCRKSI